ncbi:MAG: hypothetical protein FWG63_00645 [Defluviitaleaceae bacterium]|nr:hypothetical protein [Defluviitaleaceae bacterium]
MIVFLISNYPFLRGNQDIHTDTRFARLRHTREHRNGTVSRNSIISYNDIAGRIWGNPGSDTLFVLTNQVQAAYRYNAYANTFESINTHNNLSLTREDLACISTSSRY